MTTLQLIMCIIGCWTCASFAAGFLYCWGMAVQKKAHAKRCWHPTAADQRVMFLAGVERLREEM